MNRELDDKLNLEELLQDTVLDESSSSDSDTEAAPVIPLSVNKQNTPWERTEAVLYYRHFHKFKDEKKALQFAADAYYVLPKTIKVWIACKNDWIPLVNYPKSGRPKKVDAVMGSIIWHTVSNKLCVCSY